MGFWGWRTKKGKGTLVLYNVAQVAWGQLSICYHTTRHSGSLASGTGFAPQGHPTPDHTRTPNRPLVVLLRREKHCGQTCSWNPPFNYEMVDPHRHYRLVILLSWEGGSTTGLFSGRLLASVSFAHVPQWPSHCSPPRRAHKPMATLMDLGVWSA